MILKEYVVINYFITFISFLFIPGIIMAQAPIARQLPGKRTSLPVKIDGLLNDSAWKDAAIASNFIEFSPKAGAQEAYENRTETWLIYNDLGIYFGGYCHERTKDSIASELSGRDGFAVYYKGGATNDYIGIIFDTYKDKLNGFEYFLTPHGVQGDAKVSAFNNHNAGVDFSWNAVWEGGAVIHDDGWSFEMFIPYSAIRFGKKKIQDWGLNITRMRRKTGQQYMWSPIDPNVKGALTQEGSWTGITNIKPPLRLQLSPYFSVYANHFPLNQPGEKNWSTRVNGGLDLRYGITQAFTLDATLIPDFGQVQSDNRVLNLSPFDVQFNENRSFFTEGKELFGKANLFYSRRIGIEPIILHSAYDGLTANEKIIKNPQESKLINAFKISGRTQSGLGIGVLNAITNTRYATIEDSITKEQRKVLIDPLTNYSIVVLNQTLKNNSSVSFINTNVMRSGKDYDANVSAALFDFNNKKNSWNVLGTIAVSNLFNYKQDGENLTGYSHYLHFGKISGRFNFNITQELKDTKYTNRDLGYFTNNNLLVHGTNVSYNWIEPKSFYNRIIMKISSRFNQLFTPFDFIDKKYQSARVNYELNVQSKKLWWAGLEIGYYFSQNDFYEPNREGFFFKRGPNLSLEGYFESDKAKKYFFFLSATAKKSFKFYEHTVTDFDIRQNVRFNSKFSVAHSLSFTPVKNNVGYVYSVNNPDGVFAKSNRTTIENTLGMKYNFSNKMGITFEMRHYLSTVENKEFFTLQPDGKLTQNTSFSNNADLNVNFFNIDMLYTWQFAPGSFINIAWKNAVSNTRGIVQHNYFTNLKRTIGAEQNNNISLKVIYFLDYLQLKKKHKR